MLSLGLLQPSSFSPQTTTYKFKKIKKRKKKNQPHPNPLTVRRPSLSSPFLLHLLPHFKSPPIFIIFSLLFEFVL